MKLRSQNKYCCHRARWEKLKVNEGFAAKSFPLGIPWRHEFSRERERKTLAREQAETYLCKRYKRIGSYIAMRACVSVGCKAKEALLTFCCFKRREYKFASCSWARESKLLVSLYFASRFSFVAFQFDSQLGTTLNAKKRSTKYP